MFSIIALPLLLSKEQKDPAAENFRYIALMYYYLPIGQIKRLRTSELEDLWNQFCLPALFKFVEKDINILWFMLEKLTCEERKEQIILAWLKEKYSSIQNRAQ